MYIYIYARDMYTHTIILNMYCAITWNEPVVLMILSEGEKRSCEQWVTSHAPVIFCDSADTPTYFRDCLVLRYSIYIYMGWFRSQILRDGKLSGFGEGYPLNSHHNRQEQKPWDWSCLPKTHMKRENISLGDDCCIGFLSFVQGLSKLAVTPSLQFIYMWKTMWLCNPLETPFSVDKKHQKTAMLKSRWVAVKIPKNHLEIPLFMGKSRLNHVFQSPSDSASGRPGRRKMGALRPDRPAMERAAVIHCEAWKNGLPSGKLRVCYGKSPSLIGKSMENHHL